MSINQSDTLLSLLFDVLYNAQTIRIIQVQSCSENRQKEEADAAWKHLNSAHKAAVELIKHNNTPTVEA
jgi:hypothetical protein